MLLLLLLLLETLERSSELVFSFSKISDILYTRGYKLLITSTTVAHNSFRSSAARYNIS